MKLYDSSKFIPGLLIFLLILSIPLLYNFTCGTVKKVPELKIDPKYKQCVKPKQYMRENHMALLNKWRDEVVREADRTPVIIEGRKYEKSLTKTCMKCHNKKSQFCDQCHSYLGVAPACWNCHNLAGEGAYAGN